MQFTQDILNKNQKQVWQQCNHLYEGINNVIIWDVVQAIKIHH